jgi:hypothetical protein
VKRRKVVFRFDCEQGHRNNLFVHFVLCDSDQEAYRQGFDAAKQAKCRWCSAALTGALRLVGIEEVPLHSRYNCHGYVCECGEKVAVLRYDADGQSMTDIPDGAEGMCSKGHKRTIQNHEFPFLLIWDEETN